MVLFIIILCSRVAKATSTLLVLTFCVTRDYGIECLCTLLAILSGINPNFFAFVTNQEKKSQTR
jgi:hypothetical protein